MPDKRPLVYHKEVKMNSMNCFFQRFSALSIAVFLLLGAVGLTIISFTVLPVIGLLLVVPVLAVSIYFFRVHFNRQCQIETRSET